MSRQMRICLSGVLGLALLAGPALAGLSIGGKVWYADTENADDPAFLVGPTLSIDLTENLWISGMGLFGTYEFDEGDWEMDQTDAEAVLGYTVSIFDIGVGGRYTLWQVGPDNDELNIFGPMVYLGIGDTFGESPIGWYAAGSYMFKDFGDAEDEDVPGYEHWNAEAGLFLAFERFGATVGYRHKEWIEKDYDRTFSGVAASVSLKL